MNTTGSEGQNKRESELIERIEKNYADYQKSLLDFGKQELIDMASKIHAVSDAYSYMTSWHEYDEHELDFFLQFQNPLEVVANEWRDRNISVRDVSYTVEYLYGESDDILEDYPLMDDLAQTDDSLRRYMDVDLIDFLGKIAERVVVHDPNSINDDVNALYRAADSDNPEEKRLLWNVCSYRTHMNTERDTFIRDTRAYDVAAHYHEKDPDMFGYIVEVTGSDGQRITGNVFEVGDYYAYAMHVKETSLVLDSVTLAYADEFDDNDFLVKPGKTVTVPRYEYNDDRHRLMVESGSVTAIQFHPSESVRTMADVLRQERSRYMAYPIGSMETHLRNLSNKLTEIYKPLETNNRSYYLKNVAENHPQRDNPKFMELAERVTKNFSDYENSLSGFGQGGLLDVVGRAKAMSDAHSYMTMYHRFKDDELDFFLQFENPLEIVADNWYERNSDLDDMSFTMDWIDDHRDDCLVDYPLMSYTVTPITAETEQTGASLTHGFNGEIHPGDWVVVMPGEYFSGLVGQVSEIVPLGSPKHTGLPTDEVYVNYSVTDYSHGRIKEISLSWLYDETIEHNEGAVIAEANGLLNITDLAPETRKVIAESGDAARAFCEQTVHNMKNEKSKPSEKAGKIPVKPKTLADRLQAGKEKAEAYKAQNPQTTTKNTKKEID